MMSEKDKTNMSATPPNSFYQRFKKKLPIIFVFIIWFALLLALYKNVNDLSNYYPTFSLRYNTPVSQDAANNARSYSYENNGDFWPTFWSETDTLSISTDFRTASAASIHYSGEGHLVFNRPLLDGNLPGELETQSCAISSQLAWDLFGGTQSAGQTIKINDEEYIVSGVFKYDKQLILISVGYEAYEEGWQAVELSQTDRTKDFSQEQVKAFATTAGIGMPEQLIMSTWLLTLAKASIVIVMGALLIYILILFLCNIKWNAKWKKNLFFGCVTALALVSFPVLVDQLPPAFIPNKWSDFGFLSALLKSFGDYLTEFISITPLAKDIIVTKIILLHFFLIFFFGIASMLVGFSVYKRQAMLNIPEASENEEEKTAPDEKIELTITE